MVVAVPTFRRPDDLVELLPQLLAQAADVESTWPGRFRVRVLVVDNDPAGSGAEPCRALPAVRYVAEARPGIGAVRHRAMAESEPATLLAMIDDDERPHPHWLSSLLATWTETGAALVAGRVVAGYDGPLDPWIAAGEFFRRRNLATGAALTVAAAGNLLLDLVQVRALGVEFDPGLGLRGGEDTLFSRQLHARGGRMVWCAESVITDRVPTQRMTRRWVLARAWSHGNASTLTDLRLAQGTGARSAVRLRRLAGGGLRVLAGAVR
ncbi:MAG: hypothetical protein JWP61_580, partial [Friedmanniella sp.]|nr:hypothetical protein [Friedmanniella sp.]